MTGRTARDRILFAFFAVGFAVLALGRLGGQEKSDVGKKFDKFEVKAGGPGRPKTPAEAIKEFRLDKGLRIDLIAGEPSLESPVAMTFDPKGRIWVVEMRDYPNGPGPDQPPGGRIRILEDKDGDGFYESSSVFADKLLFANGLLLWKDGVIVTQAPNIAFLRDTDGDGRADKTEILYQGFTVGNPQLRVSHPILGMDGFIYVANGLRGGSVVKAGDALAKPIPLGGLDFRFDPITGEHDAVSGMGQYGNTFSVAGDRFVCDNRHHLRHVVLENRYLKRNPFVSAPSLVEDISELEDGPLSSGGKIFPLSRNWTTSNLHEGRFTAACSVFSYHDQVIGKDYRDSVFTCDPTGNLVHQEILRPKGATFTSKPGRAGIEFLATPDDWFRPVFLSHGPDGALYVVDMYRAVIEHPEFMPPELRKRPDLTLGREKGRIWRIAAANKPPTGFKSKISSATSEELVKYLRSGLEWDRATAHRLLREKQDRSALPALQEAVRLDASPVQSAQAAWILDARGALNEADLRKMLRSEFPFLREQAVKIADRRIGAGRTDIATDLLPLADDPSPRIRYFTALALGGWQSEDVVPALAKILAQPADSWTRLAVACSAGGRESVLLDRMLSRPSSDVAAIRDLCVIVGARLLPKDIDAVLQKVEHVDREGGSDAKAAAFERQLAVVAGLADGVGRRGQSFSGVLKAPAGSADSRSLSIFRTFLSTALREVDRGKTGPHRTNLAALFAHAEWKQAKEPLVRWMNDAADQSLRLSALRSLSAHREKEAGEILLQAWRPATPSMRREILEGLVRSPDRIHRLFDAIEEKNIRAAEIDAVRTRQLMNHPNVEIRKRATTLLKSNLPADRQAVLAAYRTSVTMPGDPKYGQEVFRKNCATCHRIGNIGVKVGPDISDTRTKTLDALLVDVIAPNQAIDNNYVNYLVTTKSGKVHSGILVVETASSVMLQRAEGQTDTILRQDIDEIVSTGISLMPEGLEKGISTQEMAHLLQFLKNWRYLDGSVPTGR